MGKKDHSTVKSVKIAGETKPPWRHRYMQASKNRLQRSVDYVLSEEATLRENRNQDESRDAKEITAAIYSILQVLGMYNLKTTAQLSAVEQSFSIRLPLLYLKPCCSNVAEYQSNFNYRSVSMCGRNTEFISALHILFLWCSDCMLPSAVSQHTQ